MSRSRKGLPAPVRILKEPFEYFFELESSSSILLFGATVIALVWANSPWAESYHQLWETHLEVGIEDFILEKSLLHWINDGLMVIFFFLIGLEIKREIMVGELNTPSKAVLPIFAAIGGMAFPILFFTLFNTTGEGMEGWAIPMATDIAFTLGILKLLGNRVPIGLKIFLTVFAIVDDMGAVLVIAIFYSSDIDLQAFGIGMGLWLLLIILSRIHLYSGYILAILGGVIWYFFYKSGIHPTVAGVLLAFAVPIRRSFNVDDFTNQVRAALETLNRNKEDSSTKPVLQYHQLSALDSIDEATDRLQSPLQELENNLHGWVSFVIMPLFALANAGVALTGHLDGGMGVAIAIAGALVFGNFIGISILSYLPIKLGWASLPRNIEFKHIMAAAILGGVGFTMSLFITNLSYTDSDLITQAKLGILGGSLIAGLLGFFLLRYLLPATRPGGGAGTWSEDRSQTALEGEEQ